MFLSVEFLHFFDVSIEACVVLINRFINETAVKDFVESSGCCIECELINTSSLNLNIKLLSHNFIEKIIDGAVVTLALNGENPVKHVVVLESISWEDEELLGSYFPRTINWIYELNQVILDTIFSLIVVTKGNHTLNIFDSYEVIFRCDWANGDVELQFAGMLTFLEKLDGVDYIFVLECGHTHKKGASKTEHGSVISNMESKLWEESISHTSESEVAKSMNFLWVHHFSLENLTLEGSVLLEIFDGACTVHFLGEVLIGVVEPFQVLSLDLEGKSFMLLHRSVLDFIKLVELSLENDEVTTSLSIKINNLLLEFFEGIYDLKEILVGEEESVIAVTDFGDDLLNWEEQCILIKVILEGNLVVFTNPE